MSEKDEIKSAFTEDDAKMHAVVRELLWLMYPQDKDKDSNPTDDEKADEVAAYIVEALKNKRTAHMG